MIYYELGNSCMEGARWHRCWPFYSEHRSFASASSALRHNSLTTLRINIYVVHHNCWALLTSWKQLWFRRIDKQSLAVLSDGAGGTMAEAGLLPFARVALQVATMENANKATTPSCQAAAKSAP